MSIIVRIANRFLIRFGLQVTTLDIPSLHEMMKYKDFREELYAYEDQLLGRHI